MDKLLNLIFTQKCMFCKSGKSLFCEQCLCTCPVPENNNYGLYIRSLKRKVNAFSTYDYDGSVRVCIKESKYGPKQFAALKILAYKGAVNLQTSHKFYEHFTAVPVPLNKRKFRSRGFNQAEIIAKIVASKCGIPHNPELLKRSKETDVQYKHGRLARYENVSGAFAAEPAQIKGMRILLVDDICTSGATFTEAAKTLYEAGADSVRCYSLSRRV